MTEKEKLGLAVLKIREQIPSSSPKEGHISQQDFANQNIGIKKLFLGSVESGIANPTLDKIVLLAKALGFKKTEILGVEIDVNKYIEENSLNKLDNK